MMSSSPAESGRPGRVVPGVWLFSSDHTYLVQSFLGQGTFGKVVKCLRMGDMKTVAIKLIKNVERNRKQAASEVSSLLRLKSLDPDKCNIVRWYRAFNNMGFFCMEFEELDQSLFEFMKKRLFQPLLLKDIRTIVQQLAIALDHLKALGFIHADLKVENVMLVNHALEPFRVKLIDFGMACEASAASVGAYIQTRSSRSPEIILGLPFTEAIDVWSLGCLTAFLYLGTKLYPGMSGYDVMRYIIETQGQPPDDLLTSGQNTPRFFQRDDISTTNLWKLKTPEQFRRETGIKALETRVVKLSSLDDIISIPVSSDPEKTELPVFVDLIKGMLRLDAAARMTPPEVLEHPFINK